jgi:PKD repeat protein
MNRENVSMAVGFVILALGIVILLFTFIQALALVTNPGDYFREQFPEDEEEETFEPPRARFSWDANDLSVDFSDETEQGDGSITSWSWEFDDGGMSSQRDPQHTFNNDGNYRVRLEVEDENGETSTSYGDIYVEMGNQDNGRSEESEGSFGLDFNFGNVMGPAAAAWLVSILYIVMFLVGGSLVKGGWNLIKPGPSTVKLKIRPKKVETEMEGAAQPYPNQRAPTYYPQQAQQGGAPHQTTKKTAEKKEYPPDEEFVENGS